MRRSGKRKGRLCRSINFLALGYGGAFVKGKTGEQQPIFVNKKAENTYYSTKNNAFLCFLVNEFMNIYHGSKQVVDHPTLGGSNPHNDYGPSFYMTTDLNQAKSWACKNGTAGVVNQYRIDERRWGFLKILDLTRKDSFNVLNWIAILMHFRKLETSFERRNKPALEWLSKYFIDVREYDVVIGFRADDSYFRFPSSFVSGELSLDDLEEIFLLGDLGKQYAFMSQKALNALHFDRVIPYEEEYVGRYYSIVSKATAKFNEVLNWPRSPDKTYVLDLMRKDHVR